MRVALVGLGNVLMGDDGFGPYVIETLRAGWEFDPAVSLEDLGTPGLDLTPHITGVDALLLVDTVHAAGLPGELRLYRGEQMFQHAPPPRLSPHDPGVHEALLIARFAGQDPGQLLLVGAIPFNTRTGPGLSPALRAAVPAAVEAVLAELQRLGLPARPRPRPEPVRAWWEAPPAPV